MRLTKVEVSSIIATFDRYFQNGHRGNGEKGSLYLFGSRTDDRKKGGDIDLLFISDAATSLLLKTSRCKIAEQIKLAIGEQRIDITICSHERARADEFIQSILPTAVQLKEWL